jgi:hypothetical protein
LSGIGGLGAAVRNVAKEHGPKAAAWFFAKQFVKFGSGAAAAYATAEGFRRAGTPEAAIDVGMRVFEAVMATRAVRLAEKTRGAQFCETNKKAASIKGGSYEEVRAANAGGDVNHIPADSVSPLPRKRGPAIHMPTPEHAQTKSFGNSRAARAHRQQQRQLILQGRWMDAIQMDIDDIRNLFGQKYDEAFDQMLQYAQRLGIIR